MEQELTAEPETLGIVAIIPMKPLADSKTRLSRNFTKEEREDLALGMLKRVIGALRAAAVTGPAPNGGLNLSGYPEVPGCASDWSSGPVYRPQVERWRKIPTRHSRFSRAAGNSTAAI